MIFGFNTDVKHGETVYHVQSEAREGELVLQTQVFVRGRCVGKRTTSYAHEAAGSSFGDQQKEQILRDQHRLVLNAIREDQLENVLDRQDTGGLAAIKQLDVQWLNADSVHTGNALTMRLRVTEDGSAVPGARLVVRFARPGALPFYTQMTTDTGGHAEMQIEMDESSLPDSAVLVQANYSGRTATRKFQLRKEER
jgi:hypothetical protein